MRQRGVNHVKKSFYFDKQKSSLYSFQSASVVGRMRTWDGTTIRVYHFTAAPCSFREIANHFTRWCRGCPQPLPYPHKAQSAKSWNGASCLNRKLRHLYSATWEHPAISYWPVALKIHVKVISTYQWLSYYLQLHTVRVGGVRYHNTSHWL